MSQKYVGITYPIQRGNTGYFSQSTSILEQTKSNFKNLVLTRKGERLGLPTFGCDLTKVIFEQLTDETSEQARLTIVEAVDNWLPFIELVEFSISPNELENRYDVYCLYRFRNNPNVTDSITLGIGTTDVVTESTATTTTKESATTIRSGVRRVVPEL